MVCTFFGHRDSSDVIQGKLSKAILDLIAGGARTFLVGNNGSFDYLVQEALSNISNTLNIKVSIVLSQINERAISGNQDLTVFPQELAGVPKRFAISKRNDYMLKRADFVIAYVENSISCSARWLKKAEKAKKKIINLAK